MNIITLSGLSMVALIASLLLRQYKPVFGIMISIAAGVVILFCCLSEVTEIIEPIKELIENAGIDYEWLKILLRSLGIVCVFQFASDCCREAGELAIAGRIELFGKISVLIGVLPILKELTEKITELIML